MVARKKGVITENDGTVVMKSSKIDVSESYLLAMYKKQIAPYLVKKFALKNLYSVPRLDFISVNVGFSHHSRDEKNMEQAVQELGLITGQKPIIVCARKSVAGFSIREGQHVGAFVTLRRNKAYDFLLRLIAVVFPRVRDFKGCKVSSFDSEGNYALGLPDLSTFPEISQDKVTKQRGVNIVIGTTSRTKEDAIVLLSCFGMPFKGFLEESRMLWQRKA